MPTDILLKFAGELPVLVFFSLTLRWLIIRQDARLKDKDKIHTETVEMYEKKVTSIVKKHDQDRDEWVKHTFKQHGELVKVLKEGP